MKKVLKVFSIIILALLIATAIAIGLCFAIIPERTKLAMDVVVEWANKPLFVAGGTIITGGMVVSVIIKFVYDRYSHSVNNKLSSCEEALKKKEEVINEKINLIEEKKSQVASYVVSVREEIKTLKESIVELCETIPNAKVKALGEKINGSCETIEKELDKKISETEEYSQETLLSLESRLHELEKVVKSYEEKEWERINH